MNEAVFIATLGAEPQVVTLALDALLAANIPITRVEVVHTLDNCDPINSSLSRLKQEFLANSFYGNSLLFYPHLLTGLDGPIVDIVTPNEIEDAFQSLYTLTRQHKQAGRIIHLCIAGGRKTMALFALAVAQILFDTDDRVWHLVSPPALIETRQFHANDPADVQLVSVPIAHWGHLRSRYYSKSHEFLEHELTPAEREVALLLINEGLSNASLAKRLGKSPKTIANQLTSIYSKMKPYFDLVDLPDRVQLLTLLGRYS